MLLEKPSDPAQQSNGLSERRSDQVDDDDDEVLGEVLDDLPPPSGCRKIVAIIAGSWNGVARSGCHAYTSPQIASPDSRIYVTSVLLRWSNQRVIITRLSESP